MGSVGYTSADGLTQVWSFLVLPSLSTVLPPNDISLPHKEGAQDLRLD